MASGDVIAPQRRRLTDLYMRGVSHSFADDDPNEEGSSQGTSKNESKQGGASVNVKVMGSGGGASGFGGWSEGSSQNTSESKSENEGSNKNRSETTSTSGSRNVMVWPKYAKNGELEHIYMVILNGNYRNISTEFRAD